MPIYIFLYFRVIFSGWGCVLCTSKICGMIKTADTNTENNQRVKYMPVNSNHPKIREDKFRNEILDSVQNNYSAVNSQYNKRLKNYFDL
jgi:hypothetical protein